MAHPGKTHGPGMGLKAPRTAAGASTQPIAEPAPETARFGGTETARFGGTEMGRFRGTETARFRGAETARFGGTETARFRGAEMGRFRGTETARFRRPIQPGSGSQSRLDQEVNPGWIRGPIRSGAAFRHGNERTNEQCRTGGSRTGKRGAA
jgi:hypothetical protein